MNINPAEFLTADQKNEISEAYKEKMLDGISKIEFSTAGKVNINKIIQREIEESAENGNLFDYMDYQEIGKAVGKFILAKVKGLD